MRAALLLLALVLVGWLLNVFLPAWVQRRQRTAPRDVGPPVPPVVPRARTPQPLPRVAPRSTPVPAGEPLVAPRTRAPVRLDHLRDVRRGIVLMTILGPCRALEPPDPAR